MVRVHRVNTIASLLPTVRPYPSAMGEVIPLIAGRAFFPGGFGLYHGASQTSLPARPLMLFGQDFDTVAGYQSSCKVGHEADSATWRGIEAIFEEHGIDPAACFHTNVLMGARCAMHNSGPSPALADAAFVERCISAACRQIEILRPSVVVALGVVPSALLGTRICSKKMKRPRTATWSDVDAAELQFIESRSWPNLNAPPFAFASSVHPCLWQSNTRHRTWGDLRGVEAHNAIWSRVAATLESAQKLGQSE